jgi:hypothetical protein
VVSLERQVRINVLGDCELFLFMDNTTTEVKVTQAICYWNACTETEKWPTNNEFADEGWSEWIEGKKLTKIDKKCIVQLRLLAKN